MGLFKTAEQISGGITCVFGDTKTGRTRQILERVLEHNGKDSVMWLSFGNLNFEERNLPNWQVASIPSWVSFKKEIVEPITAKTLLINGKAPKIIVCEGLDIAARHYYDEEVLKRSASAALPIYGEIGPKLRSAIAAMSAFADAVFFSLQATSKHENGGLEETKLGLNPNAASLLMPMASKLVYTSVVNQKEPRTNRINRTTYHAQTDVQKALGYVSGPVVGDTQV